MKRLLRRHGLVYEIRFQEPPEPTNLLDFPSHHYAYTFLNQFPPDPRNTRALRTAYGETHPLRNTRWLTYQELLDALAQDLVSGLVTLNALPRPHYPPPRPEEAPAAAPPRPAAARPPVAPAPAPATGPCSSASDSASALTSASASGVPFCEDCEDARH